MFFHCCLDNNILFIFFSGNSMSIGVYEQMYSSNSSSGPPPPYSRLPPDGHEFPSSYAEGLPDKLNRYSKYSRLAVDPDTNLGDATSPGSKSGPNTPIGPPPALPRSPPSKSNSIGSGDTRENAPTRASSLRWRRQDEKSERSVKDKIAMFSTDKGKLARLRKVDKYDVIDPMKNNETSNMKRAFTEDDVRIENNSNLSNNIKSTLNKSSNNPDSLRSSRGLTKTSTFSSMINVSSSHSDTKENVKPASSDVDIRATGSISPSRSLRSTKEEKHNKEADNDQSNVNGLHERSQSLIDIGKTSRVKRHSVGAYDRPSAYKYGVEKPEDKERRTSLNNLIEQRRKSMSKLRGLVIPESRTSVNNERPPIDLPKISSIPPPSTNLKTMSLPRDDNRPSRLYKADSISSIDSFESNTSRHSSTLTSSWKSSSPVISHKYSSSYKHKTYAGLHKHELPPPSGKSLARSTSPTNDFSTPSPTLRSHEGVVTPSSDTSFELENKYSAEKTYNRSYLNQRDSFESRLGRTEDSDNDSAVSSTQSSFSQGLSPPSSPMPDNDEHDSKHSMSRSYRTHHSPQSSIDETDATRVLKQGSIEAENRRNVLKSAKCSSGRSSDDQASTPEIIRKFSGEPRSKEKQIYTERSSFSRRLDIELKEGPKVTGLTRQPSNESACSAFSRKSSQDTSRRSSKESVINADKLEELKVSAEPVYFDKKGEMYRESQVKVAYLNEIEDDFEELNESLEVKVIAEIPLSNKQRTIEYVESAAEVTHNPNEDDRWAALEMKYGSTKSNIKSDNKIHQKRIQSETKNSTKGDFREISNRWKQREVEESSILPPQPATLPRRDSSSNIDKTIRSRLYQDAESVPRPSRPARQIDEYGSLDTRRLSSHYSRHYEEILTPCETRPTNLEIPKADVPDRKLSMPEYGNNGVKIRERREPGMGIPSRPTSLIEGSEGLSVFDSDGHYLSPAPPSPSSTSTDSREDLLDVSESSLSRTASKEVLDAFSKPQRTFVISTGGRGLNTTATPRVSDIMRAFERHDLSARKNNGSGLSGSHPRMSSVDSNGSDEGSLGAQYGSVTSLASGQRDQYGSITSLASSTSIISTQVIIIFNIYF